MLLNQTVFLDFFMMRVKIPRDNYRYISHSLKIIFLCYLLVVVKTLTTGSRIIYKLPMANNN
jgi:hypothetical protein